MRFVIAIALLLGACASIEAPAGPSEYRFGYSLGCESGMAAAGLAGHRHNQPDRFYAESALFKNGWDQGFAECRARSSAS